MKNCLRTLLLIALSLCATAQGTAQSQVGQSMPENQTKSSLTWKRSTQLQSRWSEELLRATPLPEYPRPALVRKDWLNLNGAWDFLGEGPVPPQFPDSFPDKALVPSITQAITSCLEKEYERGWYRKSIQIPDGWSGKKILLHCDAIGTKSTFYFDGIMLGTNVGGFKRISYELPACTPGKTHQIVIYFDDTDDRMPRGKLHRMSGIWQTVWIEPVPNDYIISFRQTPDIDASRLVLQVATTDPSLTITVTALDQGKSVATAEGTGRESIALQIPGQKLWTPETPFLYDLGFELKKDGVVIDRVESYFGMRKISHGEVDGAPRILLNNKVYYQVGLLEHGRWADSAFTQPSDECLKWTIQTARDMGFNTIRDHLKVESERWYYWCDKLGMLVWQDLPVPQHFVNPTRPKSEEDKQFQRDGLHDMIVQLYNHPCIISWIIFNEGGAQFEPRQMTLLAKKLDASRLVDTTSHIWITDEAKRELEDRQIRFNTDYYDTHCYERTLKFYEANNSYLPAAFGEFGGIGYAIEGHHIPGKPWGYGSMVYSAKELLREYYKLVKQAVAMRESDNLCAIIYTELTDHFDEVNGLITMDRKVVKVDPKVIKEINLQFRNPASAMTPDLGICPGQTNQTIYSDDLSGKGDIAGSAPKVAGRDGSKDYASSVWSSTATDNKGRRGSPATTGMECLYLPFTPQAGHVYVATATIDTSAWESAEWYTVAFVGKNAEWGDKMGKQSLGTLVRGTQGDKPYTATVTVTLDTRESDWSNHDDYHYIGIITDSPAAMGVKVSNFSLVIEDN